MQPMAFVYKDSPGFIPGYTISFEYLHIKDRTFMTEYIQISMMT